MTSQCVVGVLLAGVRPGGGRHAYIDGVGFQFHLDASGLDWSSVATNFARYAALGPEDLHHAELDVKLNTPASPTDLATQASIYGSVFNTGLAQPAGRCISTWGSTDKYSRIPSSVPHRWHWAGDAAGCQLQPQASAYATIHALLGTGKLVRFSNDPYNRFGQAGPRAVAVPTQRLRATVATWSTRTTRPVWLTGGYAMLVASPRRCTNRGH